jgi:hypothetical protein
LRQAAGNIFFNSGGDNMHLTLVGNVETATGLSFYAYGGNNLIGLLYPQNELITTLLNSQPNDRLLIRNNSGSFDTIDRGGTNWAEPTYRLKPSIGYWYYRAPDNGAMQWEQALD